jgi:hypothetical protein
MSDRDGTDPVPRPVAPPPVPPPVAGEAGWRPPSAPGDSSREPARIYPFAALPAGDSVPGRRVAEPVRPPSASSHPAAPADPASQATPQRAPSAASGSFPSAPEPTPSSLPGAAEAWTPRFDAPRPPEPERRRRRLKPVTVVLVSLAVVILGIGAYQVIGVDRNPDPSVLVTDANPTASGARITDPADLVRRYFAALSDGDADKALTYGPTGPGARSALTSQALQRSLQRFPLTDVNVSNVSGAATEVPVTYSMGGTPVSTSVRVTKQDDGGYLLERSTVTVAVTAKRSNKIPILVNGEKSTSGSLELLLGGYAITTGLPFLAYQVPDLQVPTLDTVAEINLLTVALTKQGQDALIATGKESLTECLRSTELAPAGCPFATRTTNPVVPGSARWSMDGNPWAAAAPRLSAEREFAEVVIDLKLHISVTYRNGTSNQNSVGFEGPVTLRVDMSRTTAEELQATWER